MSRRMSGAGRRPSAIDDLNSILPSVISGQAGDLQFADDGEEETIIITTSTGRRVSLTTRRNSQLPKLVIPRIQYDESDDNESTSTEETEYMENPGPLLDYTPHSLRAMKRNSISMPTLTSNDLERLQALYRSAEGPTDSEDDHDDDDDDHHFHHHNHKNGLEDASSVILSIADSDKDEHRDLTPIKSEPRPVKFRTGRRDSINPLPAIHINDNEMMANDYEHKYDTQSMKSATSVTSINSLASLLKEKMQMVRRKKKETKDYNIKAFVAILLLTIVFLVGFAYVMYDQKVRSRLYFEQIKFNRDNRIIHVYSKGNTVLSGKMGSTIHIEKSYRCLEHDEKSDGSECIEWNQVARLYLNYDAHFSKQQSELNSSVRCYTVEWHSLAEDFYPTDCFNIGPERGNWIGGGLTKHADWPLEKASFKLSPFVSGDAHKHQWGNAIKRYFLNSKAVAIEVDESTPLYIGINEDYKHQFCFQARYDNFSFVNRITPLPQLKYRICTANDPKELHFSLTQKSLWDGITQEETRIVKKMLEEPVWQIPVAKSLDNLTDVTLSNYTENVIEQGLFGLGHVLLSEFWQKNIGDFELDESRFENLMSAVNVSHRRGFYVSMTVQPFISTESKSFAEAVEKKILIFERNSERNVPALTRYKGALSVGMLDITNNATLPWIIEKLDRVAKKYEIDSFYLDFGNAWDVPRYYQCENSIPNPDYYKNLFMRGITGYIKVLAVSGTIMTPKPPAFLNLPQFNSSWNSLQEIITTVISYGVIGYPFIMPGAVGGDIILPDNDTYVNHHLLETPQLPEKELYIRWLQLATFLPVLRFTHLPTDFKDETVTEVAKELLNVRQKTVVPLLLKYNKDAMNEGLPLVRPLWMLDPQNAACQNITDEFAIGDELIVAPILQKGEIQREIYLPKGVWKDMVSGALRKGNVWLHNHKVPLEKVVYFQKMPDNTRF